MWGFSMCPVNLFTFLEFVCFNRRGTRRDILPSFNPWKRAEILFLALRKYLHKRLFTVHTVFGLSLFRLAVLQAKVQSTLMHYWRRQMHVFSLPPVFIYSSALLNGQYSVQRRWTRITLHNLKNVQYELYISHQKPKEFNLKSNTAALTGITKRQTKKRSCWFKQRFVQYGQHNHWFTFWNRNSRCF